MYKQPEGAGNGRLALRGFQNSAFGGVFKVLGGLLKVFEPFIPPPPQKKKLKFLETPKSFSYLVGAKC